MILRGRQKWETVCCMCRLTGGWVEMEIFLASPRGFCAGVRRAVESLRTALVRFETPIYVYNEIVHNRHVVASFADHVIFVRDVEDVPYGATLMYSAHGVSPAVRGQAACRNLRTIDATCPIVMRLHQDAKRFAANGYHLLLIGHRGHDEIVGVQGEAPGTITVISTPEEADQVVVPNPNRVAWLTQTTLQMETVHLIVERLLRRFPEIVGPNPSFSPEKKVPNASNLCDHAGNICYATQNRQEVIRRFAPQVERVVVVGSANSSNSRRLAEIASESGTLAYLVDDADALRMEWFQTPSYSPPVPPVPSRSHADCLSPKLADARFVPDASTVMEILNPERRPDANSDVGREGVVSKVLLTAGASAPERLVEECVAWFQTHYAAQVRPAIYCEETTRFSLPKELCDENLPSR